MARCLTCGRFESVAQPHDHPRRLLGSAAIYPDGTATVTKPMTQAEVDEIKSRFLERVKTERPRVLLEDPDPQVSPFVAGRHDLQPRPFKRRWWSKRR